MFVSKTFNFKYNDDNNLYNKRVRPTKNEPQQGISYLERAREGVRERERERGGWAGQQAVIF